MIWVALGFAMAWLPLIAFTSYFISESWQEAVAIAAATTLAAAFMLGGIALIDYGVAQ